METPITAEVIDTSRVVVSWSRCEVLEPRNIRAGADERLALDGEQGQVAADRIRYAREEVCSRSPPNFCSSFSYFKNVEIFTCPNGSSRKNILYM